MSMSSNDLHHDIFGGENDQPEIDDFFVTDPKGESYKITSEENGAEGEEPAKEDESIFNEEQPEDETDLQHQAPQVKQEERFPQEAHPPNEETNPPESIFDEPWAEASSEQSVEKPDEKTDFFSSDADDSVILPESTPEQEETYYPDDQPAAEDDVTPELEIEMLPEDGIFPVEEIDDSKDATDDNDPNIVIDGEGDADSDDDDLLIGINIPDEIEMVEGDEQDELPLDDIVAEPNENSNPLNEDSNISEEPITPEPEKNKSKLEDEVDYSSDLAILSDEIGLITGTTQNTIEFQKLDTEKIPSGNNTILGVAGEGTAARLTDVVETPDTDAQEEKVGANEQDENNPGDKNINYLPGEIHEHHEGDAPDDDHDVEDESDHDTEDEEKRKKKTPVGYLFIIIILLLIIALLFGKLLGKNFTDGNKPGDSSQIVSESISEMVVDSSSSDASSESEEESSEPESASDSESSSEASSEADKYAGRKIPGTTMVYETNIPQVTQNTNYAMLVCENAGMNVPIYYGETVDILSSNAFGQSPDTYLFGYARSHVVSGYNFDVMSGMYKIKVGDVIVVRTDYGDYVYKVTSCTAGFVDQFNSDIIDENANILISTDDTVDTLYMYTDYPINAAKDTRWKYVIKAEICY